MIDSHQGRGAKSQSIFRSDRISAVVLNEGQMLHIDIPTLEEFKALAQIKGDTCVSLYLPTSPLAGNIRANRTAFRALAREARATPVEHARARVARFVSRWSHASNAGMPRTMSGTRHTPQPWHACGRSSSSGGWPLVLPVAVRPRARPFTFHG